MDIRKLVPWNWFRKEEETETALPVKGAGRKDLYAEEEAAHPLMRLHREMDRLFADAFRDFDARSEVFTPLTASGLLKPRVDIGATDKEYTITVEVPGVDEKDVKVEIADNVLTIRGEKKQEKEEKKKDYYRVERSYGSFQRLLSLPGDADQEKVKAKFRKGVLTITMPRKDMPKMEAKQIDIKGDS
jgi:HSP20 family protein